jgi:hypothetical protein
MNYKDLQFSWAEQLPENCPPSDAFSPEGMDLFRLVSSNPPTIEDFYPNTQYNLNKYFRMSQCIQKSISLFATVDRLSNLQKLPRHRDKLIAKVILYQKDGLITHTFSDPAHHSWWRTTDFDPNQTEII